MATAEHSQLKKEDSLLSDSEIESALEKLSGPEGSGAEVTELLQAMNENRIISWEEAEQILSDNNEQRVVKSGLPQQVRPTEPDNETDVDESIRRLAQNDAALTEVNLNNMKRTPIPQIQRLIMAIKDNTNLKKLSLANTGLMDSGAEQLIEVIENNTTLRSVNLETNYLSGEFLARLFKAALVQQTLEEVKAVNQSPSFSTQSEREIINAVFENHGLLKVSIQLRLPEGRHKIESAMIRNAEIRRITRKKLAEEAKAKEAQQQS